MNTLPPFADDSNPILKKCSKCKKFFPATFEFFHKGKSKKDGLYASCKACRSQRKTPKELVPEGMKRCYACKQLFPANEESFSRNRSKKDGFASECKTCAADKAKQWGQSESAKVSRKRYRQEHKQEIYAWQRQNYQDHKEEIIAYQKIYRSLNKDKIRSRKKRYRESNKEAISQKKKLDYQKNKEKDNKRGRQYRNQHRNRLLENKRQYYKTPHGRMLARAHWHRRRAQKKAAGGTYTAQQLEQQKLNQKGKCYYCKVKLGKSYHIDHIVPLSRGGSNDISNIVLACPDCNLRKGTKLPHEWSDGGRLC